MKTSQLELRFQFNSNSSKSPILLLTSKRLALHRSLTQHDTVVNLNQLSFGGYDLTLRLINKEPNDTKIDLQGHIVEDLWVKIEKFCIDGIDFTAKLDEFSSYTDNQGNTVKTSGFLGYNRDFNVWFQTPGMYFDRNHRILGADQLRSWINTELTFCRTSVDFR